MRLGVLGGSFDPIHNAHLIVAQLALEQLGLDEVRFVVAGAQPLKGGRHHATAPQRAAMVGLALIGVRHCVLDRRELVRTGPSFTIDTLRALRDESPEAELFLLLGADAARGFADWRDPDGIRALARIAVCRRGGEAVPPGFDLEVEAPALELSSTAVRERAAAGRSLAGWVPPAVADYIVAQRIYGGRAG